MRLFLFLLLPFIRNAQDSPCVCTTVPCPEVGENNIVMGIMDLVMLLFQLCH